MNTQMLGRWVAGLLLLVPAAGCQNLTAFKPPSLPTIPSQTASAPSAGEAGKSSQKQLPPKQAAEVSFTLAEGLAANGHDGDAIIYYERCRQFDPKRPGIAARLAILYGRVGESKQAFAEFEKALKENPNDPSLLNNMGYCCYTDGKWAEAEQYYRKALAVDSQFAHAWVNLGMALGMQNRYEESYAAFLKAVSSSEAHTNLGFIYYTQDKKDLARAEYRQALQLDPSNQKAQIVLNMMDGKLEKSKVASASTKTPTLLPPVPPLPGQATP